MQQKMSGLLPHQWRNQPTPPLLEETIAEFVKERKKEIEEHSGIDRPEEDLTEPLEQVSNDQEFTKPLGAAVEERKSDPLTTEPDFGDTEDKPEE
jgi:hypothetical protein